MASGSAESAATPIVIPLSPPSPPSGGGGSGGSGGAGGGSGGGGSGGGPIGIAGSGRYARLLPQWRFLITDLYGVPITTLDRIARDRSITYERNQPTTIRGTVSSDSHEVNEIHDDGFPFLAEGDRQLIAFRRDYNGDPDGSPPWWPRAAGIILQYDDQGETDTGNSAFTAYDPWQYLRKLPVVNPDDIALTGNVDMTYIDSPIDAIIVDILLNASLLYNTGWPAASGPFNLFLDWGWSGSYGGTIESLGDITITFEKGTSIGDAFEQLCERGSCDIVIMPIYDPVSRPGILGELSVYQQSGTQRPEAIFAWDKPSRSLSDVSRLVDGTQRANQIRWHVWLGGDRAGPTIRDGASVDRFGDYWSEQFFPREEHTQSLREFAEEFRDTFAEHARTVSLGAIPERSPRPFTEWYLGDEVRVFASKKLRSTMSGFQRVNKFTLDISDEQLERVTDLEIYIETFSGET